jgi:hypothetical protein
MRLREFVLNAEGLLSALRGVARHHYRRVPATTIIWLVPHLLLRNIGTLMPLPLPLSLAAVEVAFSRVLIHLPYLF